MTRLFTSGLAALAGSASIRTLAQLLAVIAATCLGAATGHTQPFNQTFVSNSGTNNTTCSFTSPCQTFAQAIAATSSDGEIDCLTPGDFGAVTVSIPVTIDCENVSNGGIKVGTNAIAVTVSATGAVNLIGLDINGENASGGVGIDIVTNAVVNIRNCKIYGFASLGTALDFSPNETGAILVVDNVFIVGNVTGIFQDSLNGGSNLTVRNSDISNNSGYGIYVEISNSGTHAGATIEQTTLAFNGTGLHVQNSGSVAVIGGSTVVNNTTGVSTSGGTIYSFKNNQIGGNSTDGTRLTAYPGGPLN
jgi:hypothetical protein